MNYREHEIEWTTEKVTRMWNYYSSNPSYRHQYFGFQSGKAIAKEINKQVKFSKLKNILDFSCGVGDVIAACIPYLKGKQKISGVDFSERSIDITNTRFKDSPHFNKAIALNSLPSPLHDGHFELIIATEVIEHLKHEEFEQMLNECFRLLKRGGYLFMTTRNKENFDAQKVICPDCGCIFHRWQHITTWNYMKLQNTVERFGFKTLYSNPIAWKWRLLKKLLFISRRSSLLYIGQKTC